MTSAVQLAGQSLVQAYLEIVAPTVADPVIPLCFNPTEYQLQKANNFAEIAIPGLETPPIVRFVWDTQVFLGVLDSLNVTYVLFDPEGIPLRAKLSLSMKEYRPVEIQIKQNPTASPNFAKTWVVRRGDTLSGIAFAAYRDSSVWRAIAAANGIQDPRTLPPGLVLQLPSLS